MIRSFADGRTEDLFHGRTTAATRRLAPDLVKATLRKFDMLNAATQLHDLRSPPGNRLQALAGDLAGWHSIRVNDQWRLLFRWPTDGPEDLQLVDYH